VESRIADIWGQLLHDWPVDVRDRFFEVGGNSVLAAQVVARVNRAFQVDITVRQIFETPALADFAAAVTRASANQDPGADATRPLPPRLTRARVEDPAEMLARLDSMSEEEVDRILAELAEGQRE
jgi:hypothetical protein